MSIFGKTNILGMRHTPDAAPALTYVPARLGVGLGAGGSSISAFQQALNVILDKHGMNPIAVTGAIGPETCGVMAWIGAVGPLPDAELRTLDANVMGQAIILCQSGIGTTMPTAKGGDVFTPKKTNPREKYALPWGTKDPRTLQAQKDLDVELAAHDYQTVPQTGVLDAGTCGGFRLANDWGHTWEYDFGLDCKSFTAPAKVQPKKPTTCPAGFVYEDGDCKSTKSGGAGKMGMMPWVIFGGLALVAGAAVMLQKKKKGRMHANSRRRAFLRATGARARRRSSASGSRRHHPGLTAHARRRAR